MENRVSEEDKNMKPTAIVTGGSRGIGRAVAVRLAKEGMNLVIVYRGQTEDAEMTKVLCREQGAEVILCRGDVSRTSDCQEIANATRAAFGSAEVLVNNAGITRDALLARMTEEDFRKVLDVNLMGSWNMMKALSRIMMKQRYGRIINISSVTALLGNAGQTNYAAAKAGIIAMTKSYAREVATRNITVNAVAPGFIDTDMTKAMPDGAIQKVMAGIPMGRSGTPEDVAEAVCFLAQETAGYITGEVIRVDGGMAM